jgi:hypothetical protein
MKRSTSLAWTALLLAAACGRSPIVTPPDLTKCPAWKVAREAAPGGEPGETEADRARDTVDRLY